MTPFTDPTSGADDATAGFLAVVSDLTDYLSNDVTLDYLITSVRI